MTTRIHDLLDLPDAVRKGDFVQDLTGGIAQPERTVDPSQRSRVSKFQPCLPPEIEHGLIARETMDIDDANATLAGYISSEAARS